MLFFCLPLSLSAIPLSLRLILVIAYKNADWEHLILRQSSLFYNVSIKLKQIYKSRYFFVNRYCSKFFFIKKSVLLFKYSLFNYICMYSYVLPSVLYSKRYTFLSYLKFKFLFFLMRIDLIKFFFFFDLNIFHNINDILSIKRPNLQLICLKKLLSI